MRRYLLSAFFLLPLLFALCTGQIHAADPTHMSDPTQSRFSTDGNPPYAYYFDKIFPLFRFIQPYALKIYENRDYSRNYEDLEVCNDKRPQGSNSCSTDTDCVGDVSLCDKGGSVSRTIYNNHGSCVNASTSASPNPNAGKDGKCEYKQTPAINVTLKGTDFSADNPTTPLTYPKYQNEKSRYDNIGDPNNEITYGSQNLALNECDRIIRQVEVLSHAAQTKATVKTTGEWPLGWVDWNYRTDNGKTLFQINDELPAIIHSQSILVLQATDDFYLNSGDILTDYSEPKKIICDTVVAAEKTAAATHETPEWVTDLAQSPLYSPSLRQGYARGSICVWKICCPTYACPFDIGGNPRGLYFDESVSQAFGGALDDLFLHYGLTAGIKIYKQIVAVNPLIRFVNSSGPEALPSKIASRLNAETGNPCLKYLPDVGGFNMLWFGSHLDYLKPGSFLSSDQSCPDYALQPELTKEQAGALSESPLSRLINLVWGNQVDNVAEVARHLITIPDAMGQSISEIQDPVYQTHDNATALKKENDYNKTLSNIVDATSDFLYAGKAMPVAFSRRFLGLYGCSSFNYSSPEGTESIQAYALGNKVGCFGSGTQPSGGNACTAKVTDAEVTAAANAAGTKYGIPGKWLEGMFKYEGDTTKMGDGCQEETVYKVMGPLQISASAYRLATCANERFDTAAAEKAHCSDTSKLSRCSLEGSFELAARTLLQKLNAYGAYSGAYDCHAGKANPTLTQLYRATNAYSGCGIINGIPYAQAICQYAGNCPSPLPPTGSPVSCAGN